MTYINDLDRSSKNVNLEEVEVSAIGETRTVNLKSGGQAQVCDILLKDVTGEIGLTLWDAQIKLVKEGSKISIANGYVSEFRGQMSLNIGKYGQMSVVEF
jgi:replication factor A1